MAAARPARRGGGASGFNLNYDIETPLRAIDFGGPDHGQRSDFLSSHPLFLSEHVFQRLTDFVTKSIENTTHVLSVQEAMKKLGLNG